MKTMIPIPAGTLVTITSGEYGNVHIIGLFRAIKTLDCGALQKQWIQIHPDQVEEFSFEEINFIAWAVVEGWLEPVDRFEWYLANSGSVDEMLVYQPTGYLYEVDAGAEQAEDH